MPLQMKILVNKGIFLPGTQEDPLPLLIGQNKLSGIVSLGSNGPTFGSLRIILEGDLINQIWVESEHTYKISTNGQRLFSLVQESRASTTGITSSAQDVSVPFAFDIPDQILPPYGSAFSTFDTPPSTCIRHTRDTKSDPVPYAHCYVSYRIRSQAILEGDIVGEVVTPFKVYATSDAQPPLCFDDFPGEYRLFDRRTMSSFFGLKKYAQMTAEALEPQPIFLTDPHPSTTLSVHLKLCKLRRQLRPDDIPKRSFGECSIIIKSETYFSVTPHPHVPTSSEVTDSHDMAESSSVHFRRKYKVVLSPWKYAEHTKSGNLNSLLAAMTVTYCWAVSNSLSECHTGCRGGIRREADAQLTIDCGNLQFPPPTFLSPWISRKYVIYLSLSLDTYPGQELHLRIPVQVLY